MGLLSGGRTRSSSGWSPLSSVEIFGGECTVADLPQPRSYHVSFVTPDDRVMVCGGLEGWSQSNSASCLEYNLNSNVWRHHSYLRAKREKAVSVSFPSGVLVLGGQNVRENYYTVPAWSTSDYLARGSRSWQPGPDLPIVGGYAYDDAMCAVAISDTSMLVIGLRSQYQYIWEYSIRTLLWKRWPATFRVERHASACHKVGDTVVVAGGYPGFKSTEVIDLNTMRIRQAGDTASPRFFFGFLEMGLAGRTLVLTFGGAGDAWVAGGVDDSTVLQEWNMDSETWSWSPAILVSRDSFSSVSVRASLVCKASSSSTSVEDTLLGFCRDGDFQETSKRSIDWCRKETAADRLLGARRGRQCHRMPCYALNHCPRYSDRWAAWLVRKWPCCCAHPKVRNKGRFKPKCDKMFKNV